MGLLTPLSPYITYIKLAGVAVLMAGAAYGGYRFELGRYEQLVAADAIAQTKAVEVARTQEKKIAKGNQEDAVAQAYFRGKMDATTVNLVLGVPENVTISQDNSAAAATAAGCVTYGFVRVLTAGERGVPAESLDYPSGESADTCTAVKPSDLAAAVAQDLAAGTSNGHQLDSLITAVKRNDAILTGSLGVIGRTQLAASVAPPLHHLGVILGSAEKLSESPDDLAAPVCVIADMPQPNDVGKGDPEAGPPRQWEIDYTVKPQVIKAPRAEKGGWQPVNTRDCLAPTNGPDVQYLEAGGASLKGSLGDIRVNVYFMLPDW